MSNLITDQEFRKKWGTLYDEFKNDKGFWSTQFYMLFTLRRVIFALSQVFLNSMLNMQISLNLFFCALHIFFLVKFQPYTSRLIFFSAVIDDCAVLVIMVISYFFIYNASTSTLINLEIVIAIVITFIIGMNTVVSFILLMQAFKELWCKLEEKRAIIFLESIQSRSKVQQQEFNISSTESQPTAFKKLFS